MRVSLEGVPLILFLTAAAVGSLPAGLAYAQDQAPSSATASEGEGSSNDKADEAPDTSPAFTRFFSSLANKVKSTDDFDEVVAWIEQEAARTQLPGGEKLIVPALKLLVTLHMKAPDRDTFRPEESLTSDSIRHLCEGTDPLPTPEDGHYREYRLLSRQEFTDHLRAQYLFLLNIEQIWKDEEFLELLSLPLIELFSREEHRYHPYFPAALALHPESLEKLFETLHAPDNPLRDILTRTLDETDRQVLSRAIQFRAQVKDHFDRPFLWAEKQYDLEGDPQFSPNSKWITLHYDSRGVILSMNEAKALRSLDIEPWTKFEAQSSQFLSDSTIELQHSFRDASGDQQEYRQYHVLPLRSEPLHLLGSTKYSIFSHRPFNGYTTSWRPDPEKSSEVPYQVTVRRSLVIDHKKVSSELRARISFSREDVDGSYVLQPDPDRFLVVSDGRQLRVLDLRINEPSNPIAFDSIPLYLEDTLTRRLSFSSSNHWISWVGWDANIDPDFNINTVRFRDLLAGRAERSLTRFKNGSWTTDQNHRWMIRSNFDKSLQLWRLPSDPDLRLIGLQNPPLELNPIR